MDLFKKAIDASRKQFGKADTIHYQYNWVCQRCNHKMPVLKKDGKKSFMPPTSCEVENCSGTIFKLETISDK